MISKYTVYIADKKINEFMEACDLREKGKWYVVGYEISTKTAITEQFLMEIIEKSYVNDDSDFWIPAIECMNNMFFHYTATHISDGHIIMFNPDGPVIADNNAANKGEIK